MVHERERARAMNYQDPIHETAERTHRCYDEVVELLLRYRSRRGPGLKILMACLEWHGRVNLCYTRLKARNTASREKQKPINGISKLEGQTSQ
jgi:hypothetical protein